METNEITERVIGCAYTVANSLGAGFFEGVYENALVHELRKNDLKVCKQYPVSVTYDGVVVGDFFVDVLVEDSIIVELKAVRALDRSHMAQCLNYLRATNLSLALLINFGTSKIEVKRVAL